MSALAIDSSVDIMIGEETSEAASIAAEFSEAVEQSLVYGGLLSEMAPPDMWQAGGSSSSDMWQGVSPQLGLCRRCSQSYTEATKELGKVREILSQVVGQEATGGEVLEPWRYEFF